MHVWCVQSCGRHWSVCKVVSVPYVGAVTLMGVPLFVLHVSMVREYEGARVMSMLVCGTRCNCGECMA